MKNAGWLAPGREPKFAGLVFAFDLNDDRPFTNFEATDENLFVVYGHSHAFAGQKRAAAQ